MPLSLPLRVPLRSAGFFGLLTCSLVMLIFIPVWGYVQALTDRTLLPCGPR